MWDVSLPSSAGSSQSISLATLFSIPLHFTKQFGPRVDSKQPLRQCLQPGKIGDGFQSLLLFLGWRLAELLPPLAQHQGARLLGPAFRTYFIMDRRCLHVLFSY